MFIIRSRKGNENMKEFKFRAWDKLDSRIIDFEELVQRSSIMDFLDEYIDPFNEMIGRYESSRIYSKYLGIEDRIGNEIYSDSIVKLPLVYGGEGDVAIFVFTAPNYILKGKKGYYEISMGEKSRSESYEVIGSIYENPELLLDSDSICYGCQHYTGGEVDCNPPSICIEGSLNKSNIEKCPCYKFGESLNSGMKCSNCGREL